MTFDFAGKLSTLSTVSNTSASVESYPITLTFTSYNTSRRVEVNQTNQAIKFQGPSNDNAGSSLTVSCPTGGLFAITKVEIYTKNDNISKFSASNGSYSTGATTGDETSIASYKGTWTDGSAGNITEVTFQATSNVDDVKAFKITYTDNRTSLSQFEFNSDEVYIHDGSGSDGTYVNGTTFVYDASKTKLKTKLKIDPALSTIGATASGTYFTVTSSNPSVLDVSGTLSYSDASNGTRLYIDGISIAGIGNATLTFTFAGTDSYKSNSIDVPISVIDHSVTPFSGTYKYTWDFANGDWTSTIAQLGYGNGSGGNNWTKTIVEGTTSEARPTYHTCIPQYSGIDIIDGLEFNLSAKEDLCLDWFTGRKALWLYTNATITIANLVKGQTITITADHDDYTIEAGSATKSGNVITVTADGSVTIKIAQATRISSIAVSNSQYGWTYTTTTTTLDKERPTSGTFTFTEDGPIAGGTVIDEVPGITLTVGASGDAWEVKNISTGQTPIYAASLETAPNTRPNPTAGCFYEFTPSVNGYLSLNIKASNSHNYFYRDKKNGTGYSYLDLGSVNGNYDISIPLLAGHTYTLVANNYWIYLHSFTFTPAFLQSGKTAEEYFSLATSAKVDNFTARIGNPAISDFPKLIDRTSEAQQNSVKFAGDKTKVYLYKNNDVEVIGNGENILIRGTVLDKNNEDGLVAYYYLNAYVLSVTSYELEDQEYIATSGLTDGNYQIVFSGNVVPVSGNNGEVTVQVQKDNETPWNVTAHTYTNQPDLFIPIDPLEAGAIYRITVPENSIALANDATTKNSKIERTFSVNADGEAQVKMIYPSGLATVGTSVILETYINGTVSGVNNSKKVKGILSDGTTEMVIDATFGTNQLAFKPTSTLQPNTTYTLTIPLVYDSKDNKIYLTAKYTENPEVYYQVTHNKVFKFTTGSSSGTAPYVIENGTTPAAGATIPGSAYSGGTISFTFDQTVEIEPYTIVNATPINGSEATASGQTGAPGATNNTLTVGADGKTVSFNYSADGLKYDLYYQVVIPANTIIGAGGLPNSLPITLNFSMGKNPSATDVNPSSFYPHTWDFNKFGDETVSGTTAYNIVNNCGDPGVGKRGNSLYSGTGDGYTTYTTKNQSGYEFDQGADVYFNNKNGDTEVMDEFEGMRISLVSSRSNRFEIRNITSKETNNKNLDGTDKWVFRMNGNTHYFTLSKVPKGKLYMVVSAVHLGINSPNAVFESVSGEDYTLSNNNTLLTGPNANRRVVINVNPPEGEETQDVSFCVQNLSLEKIGVPVTSKKAQASFENYFTDCQSVPQRFELTSSFTGNNLTAYYIPTDGYTKGETTITMTPTQVAAANEGTIIKASQTSNDVPLFRTDVNTEGDGHSTYLVGVLENTTVTATETVEGTAYRNYFFTNLAGKVNDQGEMVGEKGSVALGFYRAVASSTLGAHKCYLRLPQTLTEDSNGSKSMIMLNILDWDDIITGVTRTHTEKVTPHNDVYYTLSGMRLSGKPTQSGLYIVNGKKVYVK